MPDNDLATLREHIVRLQQVVDADERGLTTWWVFLEEAIDNIVRWKYGKSGLAAAIREAQRGV